MKKFIAIWLAQIISAVGSGLTSFALGIWIYRHSSSTTLFALVGLCSSLPGALLMPVAGSLVDRYKRGPIMVVCNLGSAAGVFSVGLLESGGHLQPWELCALAVLVSICRSLNNLAYSASVFHLVSRQQLQRVNAMGQIIPPLSQIVSPALAGILISIMALGRLFFFDSVSFLCLALVLLAVSVPSPPAPARRTSMIQDAAAGWRYVRSTPGLTHLMLFSALGESAMQSTSILITPLALSIVSPKQLGIMMSVIFGGMLTGSLTASALPVSRKHWRTILLYGAVQGTCLCVAGMPPRVVPLTLALTMIAFCAPFAYASMQTLVQLNTPVEYQGRTFAALRMLSSISIPCSFLISGPFVDQVLRPALTAVRSTPIGTALPIQMVMIILGVCLIVASVVAYRFSQIPALKSEPQSQATPA